jgi:heme/copper-type cytochrome/quinol oxidase subunit 4
MSSAQNCPHCGVENISDGAFCESCGKALPSSNNTGPRIVAANEFAVTAVGQNLQSDDLQRQSKKASGALLTVAVIQTLVGLAFFIIHQNTAHRTGPASEAAETLFLAVTVGSFIVAAAFWCLYSWSQIQPLPAAIVGLVIYGTLIGLNVFTAMSRMSHNPDSPHSGPFGGIGIGWLDIVIMAILVRAISAGAAYRKLLRQGAIDTTSPSTLPPGDVAAL